MLRRGPCTNALVRILILILLFLALPANGATWFVAPRGHDSNAGSESRPFRTINRGIAAAHAGDTVAVRKGVYREAVLLWDKHGAADARIRIAAHRGEKVVIDGKGVRVKNALVAIGRSAWVHFEGFEVRNSAAAGIVVYEARSVTIRANDVHHSRGGGIHVKGSDIAVRDNSVHHNVLSNSSGKSRQWSQALASEDSTGVLISGNRVFQNFGEGIDAIRTDRVVITQNRVRDNFGANIYLDNAQHATVDRNFVRDTGARDFRRDGEPAFGVALANERYSRQNPLTNITITNNIIVRSRVAIYYADSEYRGGLHRTVIAHNTIYGATWAALVLGGRGGRNAGHDTTTVANNVIVQRSGGVYVARSPKGLTFRSNAWWGGKAETRVRASGDVVADPELVKRGGSDVEDYRLRPGSPCRDAGTALKVGRDHFGAPRRGRPDLGAHEL